MADRRLDLYDSDIGSWIKRGRKWHFVESVVDSGAITRCGRRMLRGTGYPFQISDVMPLTRMIGQPQLCKAGCDREAAEA